jgi:hypothetical protein
MPAPPRYVENCSVAPSVLSALMNASLVPTSEPCASRNRGKSLEAVLPVTVSPPSAPTERAEIESWPSPPW